MSYTLMHISDVHAGPPWDARLAAQVVREAHALRPDLIVVSGDFVQRADIRRQWRTIKAFLAELPQPHLYVPGNHDVPVYNMLQRLRDPLAIYRREISEDLNPVFERPGLAVVGGCSAHGLTIDGGRLASSQVRELEQRFARQPANTCRVAVLHHHLINPPGCEGRNTMQDADSIVRLFDRMQVDLLLCGHVHVSYVGTTLDVRPDLQRGTIICQSGTTTSRRGKARERGKNSYNVIEIDDHAIRIGQHLYLEDAARFVCTAEHLFPRRSSGAYLLPREERVVTADRRVS
jgi:3',5'-cyclic AMP phosphodiesterase CpdA